MAAAAVAAAASVLKCSSLLMPCKTRSTSTFTGCLPSARGKWNDLLSGPLSDGMAARRVMVFQSHSQSFFHTSLRASADIDVSTDALVSPSISKEASTDDGPPSSSPVSDPVKEAANALDMRVGLILRAWRHPEADSLYVEEVDVGEPEPRTICSGLVNYLLLDDIQGIKVVVLANLKPRNMRGVKSSGMLLAASDASHDNVELLLPPEGSVPGERIWFGSEEEKENQLPAASPNQVQKKKIWELVQPQLWTDSCCVAALGMHPMRTSAGVVVSRSLKNAKIS